MAEKLAEKPKEQIDKFRDAARELETDDDEEAFDKALRNVANSVQTVPKRTEDDDL